MRFQSLERNTTVWTKFNTENCYLKQKEAEWGLARKRQRCHSSAAWMPRLAVCVCLCAWIVTWRLLFRWKNSNLYLPWARAFYTFTLLIQTMLSSQRSRSGHHVLGMLLQKTTNQKEHKHPVNYRIQGSSTVGQGQWGQPTTTQRHYKGHTNGFTEQPQLLSQLR